LTDVFFKPIFLPYRLLHVVDVGGE